MSKKSEIIFVNEEKYKRAKGIVELLGRAAKTEGEQDTQAKFSAFLEEAGVDSKKDKESAVEFVYEKLGGLTRTHEEAEQVEEKAAKAKKSKKGAEKDEDEGESEE